MKATDSLKGVETNGLLNAARVNSRQSSHVVSMGDPEKADCDLWRGRALVLAGHHANGHPSLWDKRGVTEGILHGLKALDLVFGGSGL